MLLLTSVSMAGCNNTGSSSNSQQKDSVQESNQLTMASTNGTKYSASFTRISGLDDSSESRVQHYGQKFSESADNYPGKRFGAGYANIDLDKLGSFTLMYGGCDTSFEENCYNDIWLYNHQTNNWAWVGGESSVMGFEARMSHPELEKYSFSPSLVVMQRYEYTQSVHKNNNSLYLNFFVYPEIRDISPESSHISNYNSRTASLINYTSLCDRFEQRHWSYSWDYSKLAGLKELCASTYKTKDSRDKPVEYIFTNNSIGTAHEVSLAVPIESNMIRAESTSSKWEHRSDKNLYTGEVYQKRLPVALLSEVTDLVNTTGIQEMSRRFLSIRDLLPSYVNKKPSYTTPDYGKTETVANLGYYSVGGDKDYFGIMMSSIFKETSFIDPDKPRDWILRYSPIVVNYYDSNGVIEKVYRGGEGLDDIDLVLAMFDYKYQEYESSSQSIKRLISYASVPRNRSNSAVAISSDNKSLYLFGGFGVNFGEYSGTGAAYSNILSDLSCTESYGNQCSTFEQWLRMGALGDFWRLDLETGKYQRLLQPREVLELDSSNYPTNRIGATMWESDGAVFLFGGSSFIYQTMTPENDRTVASKCYFSDLWMFKDGYWSQVAGERNKCVLSSNPNVSYPSSQSNAIVWRNKSSGLWNILGGNDKFKGDLATFLPGITRINGWDEHWEIQLTSGGGGGDGVTMSLAPEKSVNPLWNGFDTLSSIPLGKFGLREISFKVHGQQPLWGYSLNFRNGPEWAGEFSIDLHRSSCRIDGQGENDATLNNWSRNYDNNTYSCSYVLKFEPQTKSSAGIMSVDLLGPDGKAVDSTIVPYSVR